MGMYMKVYDVDDGVQCTVCNYLCRYNNAHMQALAREYCRAHASAIRTANGGKDTRSRYALIMQNAVKPLFETTFSNPALLTLVKIVCPL